MENTVQNSEKLVYISYKDDTCSSCGTKINRGDMITKESSRQILCLTCANLNHLVFLKSGNRTLSVRSRKYSAQSAEVVKYSKARKRNERQGLLVEPQAIEIAQKECLMDSERREKRRDRAAQRRAVMDERYVESFSRKIREMYPNCPVGLELEIARHACEKYSGRVGRSAAAKKLEEGNITLAVRAHIRHEETNYDVLLMEGHDRSVARQEVQEEINNILKTWK